MIPADTAQQKVLEAYGIGAFDPPSENIQKPLEEQVDVFFQVKSPSLNPHKPQCSPVQSVLAEKEESASSASQRRPRWWHLQRCAADWLNAALQPPATAPVPVVIITAAGLAST